MYVCMFSCGQYLHTRRDPYGVSKKTIDLTAIQLNKELNEKVNEYYVHS